MFRRLQRTASPDAQHDRDRPEGEIEDHDRGLAFDLATLVSRRRALTLVGGAGLVAAAAACAPVVTGGSGTTTTTGPFPSSTGASTTSTTASTTTTADTTSYTAVPEETGGPYPGDGTNGPNILTQSGVVRSDIRTSFGTGSATAAGVLNMVRLKILSLSNGAAPLVGAAVYIWHCNRDGAYSMYSQGVTNENYLRGVQELDAAGTATFTSIFPAAYPGRWPHIHFEVYSDVANAVSSGPIVKTSQIALPKEACDAVYATAGYEQSVRNLSETNLTQDMVFGDDGGIHQIASMSWVRLVSERLRTLCS